MSDSHKDAVKWAKRLKRLIKDAPPGVIALVGHGSIQICDETELREYEESHGHRDNVESIIDIYPTHAFEPNSESM